MEWNLSYKNFKLYGPDHPSVDVLNSHFQTDGAWLVWLTLEQLSQIVDDRRMSVNIAEIEADVVGDVKWNGLLDFLASNKSVAPPWATIIADTEKLGPAHGLHRFQYAIFMQMKSIPVVVNFVDARLLNSKFGCRIEKMAP
ncbi:hypothetical protein [Collimonas arenae]|uniref:hypothetical protein n=1 Tax=Collimonas arenae TaxID=279058 RepID=UPI0007784A8E|nr:hypothetical protein [Collimonas arenae]